MLAKGTFLCIHPVFFFHAVLSKLSSSPSTLDRHVTIYLQREQSFSRHLSTNNVKEHTAGSQCRICPHSDAPMVCAITALGSSIFQQKKPACASLLSASPLPEAVQPRAVPSSPRAFLFIPSPTAIPPNPRSVPSIQASCPPAK